MISYMKYYLYHILKIYLSSYLKKAALAKKNELVIYFLDF